MRIDYIQAKNFFKHKDTILDLTQTNGVTILSGANGQGKSSISIEAISYVLFNDLRVDDIDEAIRHEENQMSVTLKFYLNGQDIIVVRSKKRGKAQKLELYIDGIQIHELPSELQKRIHNLLSLSPNSFRSSVFLRQDDSNFFSKAKPEERKQIISDILDLSQYERLEKIAREKRSELKSSIKAKQSFLDTIEEVNIEKIQEDLKIIDIFLDKIQIKIKELEDKLNIVKSYNIEVSEKYKQRDIILVNNNTVEKRINKGIDRAKEILEEKKKIDLLLQNTQNVEIDSLQDKIEILQNSFDDKSKIYSENKDLLQNLIKLETKKQNQMVADFKSKVQEVQTEIKLIENNISKLSKLNDPDCPTCLRPMNKNEIQEMKKSLEDNIFQLKRELEKRNKPLISAQKLLDEISEGDFESAKNIQKDIDILKNEIIKLKKDLNEKQATFQSIVKNQKLIIENKEKLLHLDKENEKIKEEISFLKTQINPVPDIKDELQDEKPLKEKINTSKQQQNEIISSKAKKEQSLENAIKNESIKKKTLTEITVLMEELELVEILVVAFGKNGIPASIIDTVLPEIQEKANNFLAKMSDETLEFKFETQEVLKNGTEKNTLNLSVFDGIVWRNFESLSGGEGFRVSLAIRLALSDVLSRRAGISLDSIILDEPASSLDLEGRQAFCSVIKSLEKVFSRIILTTHLDIGEEFDNKIELVSIT